MSAWVIGLGLAAGYLVNKNMVMKSQLEQSVANFNSAAKPATGGVTSKEVRSAHNTTTYEVYGDMNTDLSRGEMDTILKKQATAASEVERFDAGPSAPQVVGVMMQYDRLGV